MSDDAADSPNDYIADVRGQWETIFPDLDTSMVAVMGRIARIAQVVQVRSDEVLAAQGVTRGEFDVISLLARHGGTLSPTRVSTELIISGAGVTKRLKRLGSAGLVSRIPGPGRRQRFARATDRHSMGPVASDPRIRTRLRKPTAGRPRPRDSGTACRQPARSSHQHRSRHREQLNAHALTSAPVALGTTST